MTREPEAISDGAAPSDLLDRVARATALREGPEGVALVLRTLAARAPLPLRELAVLVRLPLPVVAAVRRELEKAGLLTRGRGVALSEAGRRWLAAELGIGPRAASPGPPARAPGESDPRLAPVLAAMQAHLDAGPPVDVTLDQAPCTAETALRRALAMVDAGAVDGRRIVILGDDDSVSLALALVARSLGLRPGRLAVLELDPGWRAHLAGAAERHGFELELVAHDLRQPLPAALRGAFDVFETDPPYTLAGLELFLARAIEALERRAELPGFLSYADLGADEMLAVQARLTGMGLAVRRVVPSFNRYAGAAVLGSVGQWLELATTAGTRTPLAGAAFAGPLYTGELRPKSRRYRCQACRTTLGVGAGERFATIGALKAAGCPGCGGVRFAPLPGRGR